MGIEHFDLLHAVAGLMVGVAVGLTGVGGGSLMTPVLVLLFGVSPQTAVGTDLIFAASTKTVGSAVHGWRETVDWRIVRRLATGSLPAAFITLYWLGSSAKLGKDAQHVVLLVLASMLLLTALAVIFQRQLISLARRRRHSEDVAEARAWPTVLLGALIGVVVSISSVGAGAIGVTALLMLYPGLPLARIIGSDIAHAVPLTLVAGVGHWLIGDVNLVLLGNLLVGSVPGVVVGSLLATRASDNWLRPALAAVLLVSGWQLMVKATAPVKAEKVLAGKVGR
ncbi:MAG: sulfite exporter TauE/SafE family protein [Proteobacteria bacterium]|nr:sulfite exporter TauE/SafE family protein [Pseudomonadota bacterium]